MQSLLRNSWTRAISPMCVVLLTFTGACVVLDEPRPAGDPEEDPADDDDDDDDGPTSEATEPDEQPKPDLPEETGDSDDAPHGGSAGGTTGGPMDDTTGETGYLGGTGEVTGTGEALDVCGDAVVGPGEACDDGVNDGGYGGCAVDCQAFAGFCGDGVLQSGEECEFGGATSCEQIGMVGPMVCLATCKLDVSQCVGCGNGVVEEGELCDGASVAGETCGSMGFYGGELMCNVTCDGFAIDRCV